MLIRELRCDELDRIQPVYRQLFSAMAEMQPENFQPCCQDMDSVRKTLEEGNADVLAALEEETVLGFAFVKQMESPPYPCYLPQKYAYLIDLAVDENQRCKGIGAALLKAVKQWAVSRGLSHLELSVLAQNRGARRLYEREGFEPVSHIMRCGLDQVESAGDKNAP